jgi:formate dehydrogenase major subunit
VQRIRKAIDPVGESKPDWKLICAIAAAMGKGQFFDYETVEEIWDEIRLVWPVGYGITYQRLDENGLQWPCPSENHSGTKVMHVDGFPIGKKAAPYRFSRNLPRRR